MTFFLISATKVRLAVFLTLTIIISAACNQSPTFPKPRGYLRIDLPEKHFLQFDSTFPYSFEYPKYAKITFTDFTADNPYWMNIDYPAFQGRIHLSYKPLKDHNLYQLKEDARDLVFRHAQKAAGIKEAHYSDELRKVYAKSFTINGKEAASPFQFYITDSTDHFIRGALYFNLKPNNDSLQPVINFIIDDIRHIIETINWN
jgi:gliding motility-associated lipoprotein GldD